MDWITSLAFKGEATPAGATASWVIGGAAAGAVDVLERLQPHTVDDLFRTIAGNSLRAETTRTQNVARTNQLLNHFAAWVNTYCRNRGAPT
ncbi:MAG TPA: hypothetical protein VK659_16895 [Asanoa sp.]|nr:hypothetical protein [Asanoa sp.]